MAIEYRSLFCDESDIDGKQFFYIGGIECTNRRAEILKEKILELRKKKNIGGEFKWTKISNNEKYINQYKDLVNIFANDKFSKVYLMKIKKNQKWKMWSNSEEERFFKCYYNFLMMTMKTYEDVRYLSNPLNDWTRFCKFKYKIVKDEQSQKAMDHIGKNGNFKLL